MRFYRLIVLGVIDVLSGLPYCVINVSPNLTHGVIYAVVRPVEQLMAPCMRPGDPCLTFRVRIDDQTMKSLVT
jgi:hypothetical protein